MNRINYYWLITHSYTQFDLVSQKTNPYRCSYCDNKDHNNDNKNSQQFNDATMFYLGNVTLIFKSLRILSHFNFHFNTYKYKY